ncbi:rhamnan synthesis F family protein [Brucella pseudintermedia]|uniref:Rhamnan synthesis F family protein n=1 Tax=Brucella pseudintermedia TaxID=370111 RepID=A0ABY5UEL2_9HYPH|nr:rhamnan synthesis F family protein [Brucella pseudintermedia]UWL60240.1 rhamnan synthesis F family protein [Brucella pseudintermedia]
MRPNCFAIIAHFDPKGKKTKNWNELLKCISAVCDSGVVVSTGITRADICAARSMGFNVITRENVGYDFLSYAVGLDASKYASPSAKRLVCNDSIYVSDPTKFINALRALIDDPRDVMFLTKSKEVFLHGQSFGFSLSSALFNRRAFREFFNSIRPQPTKWSIIVAYELGFTRLLDELNVSWSALIDADDLNYLKDSNLKEEVNPSHYFADEILKRYGFAKIERLISNPKKFSNSKLVDDCISKYKSELIELKLGDTRERPKAIVICHCHYLEVVDEIISYLDRLPDGCRIYISSSSSDILTQFTLKWRRRHIPLHVVCLENWGRDVRPFVHIIQSLDMADDVPILKIHGKRSLYSPDGEAWRRELFRYLLPTEDGILKILDKFEKIPELGILGAPGSYVSNAEYWGSNRERIKSLLRQNDIECEDSDLGFFAGTMYWIRSQCAVRSFANIDISAFEAEASQRDGTLGHALERSVPMMLRAEGWQLMELDSDEPLNPALTRNRRVVYF